MQQAEADWVLYRDVKLENVFIANDGRVRLGDFGLTMSMKQEMAISPVGTVEYMAPEVSHCPFQYELKNLGTDQGDATHSTMSQPHC